MKCDNCNKKIESKKKQSTEISFFDKWSNNKICLEAVKKDGFSLQFVKEQNEEICLEAVKQNGDSLKYVKNKKIFWLIMKNRNK